MSAEQLAYIGIALGSIGAISGIEVAYNIIIKTKECWKVKKDLGIMKVDIDTLNAKMLAEADRLIAILNSPGASELYFNNDDGKIMALLEMIVAYYHKIGEMKIAIKTYGKDCLKRKPSSKAKLEKTLCEIDKHIEPALDPKQYVKDRAVSGHYSNDNSLFSKININMREKLIKQLQETNPSNVFELEIIKMMHDAFKYAYDAGKPYDL